MMVCPVCARPSARSEAVVVFVRPGSVTNRRYKFIEVTLLKYACGHITAPPAGFDVKRTIALEGGLTR